MTSILDALLGAPTYTPLEAPDPEWSGLLLFPLTSIDVQRFVDLTEHQPNFSKADCELCLLDEMTRLRPEAEPDGIERMVHDMRRRNERLTEWMAWQAATKGTLEINRARPDSTTFIDYGFAEVQKPTAATPWNTADASPLDDLREWAKTPRDLCGHPATRVFMSSPTLNRLITNRQVAAECASSGLLPRHADLEAAVEMQVTIYDAGYRDDFQREMRPYLEPGVVVLATDQQLPLGPEDKDGQPTLLNIAEMIDGGVLVTAGPDALKVVHGIHAEVFVEPEETLAKEPNPRAGDRYIRVTSTRLPRVNVPGAFVTARVF